MKVRHNHIHFRRGQRFFAVRRSPSPDAVSFIGSVNGIDCGAWPTKEAAVQGLLRRTLERKVKKEAKAQLAALLAKPKPPEPARAAFWVYESNIHHTTKVHASWCSACNDGQGKARKGNTKSGKWWPYPTLDEAVAAARTWQPDRNETCSLCVKGSYRRSGDVSY